MSLTSWTKWDSGVLDNIIAVTGCVVDKWLPDVPVSPIKAYPRTNRYAMVGTAFDYAMRLRLMQINRIPSTAFTAAYAVGRDSKRRKFMHDFWLRWGTVVTSSSIDSLLSDCIILAGLEAVYRSGRDFGNDAIFSVDPADVDDLRSLVSLIDDNNEMWKRKPLYLNPTFGESSTFVGGADADLIIDGTLIDIKTTKYLELKKEYLRQLIGYYILNLREDDPYNVRSLGIYFSRHGVLLTFPIPVSPDNPSKLLYRDSKGRLVPAGWSDIDTVWDSIEDSLCNYRLEFSR